MSQDRWHALREMIERWAQVAAQIEHHYPLTFDDYLNDLDLRRLIDERMRQIEDPVIESSEVGIALSITNALAAADERFRQATVNSQENVWGVANERESGWDRQREWYYYRMPKVRPREWSR